MEKTRSSDGKIEERETLVGKTLRTLAAGGLALLAACGPTEEECSNLQMPQIERTTNQTYNIGHTHLGSSTTFYDEDGDGDIDYARADGVIQRVSPEHADSISGNAGREWTPGELRAVNMVADGLDSLDFARGMADYEADRAECETAYTTQTGD